MARLDELVAEVTAALLGQNVPLTREHLEHVLLIGESTTQVILTAFKAMLLRRACRHTIIAPDEQEAGAEAHLEIEALPDGSLRFEARTDGPGEAA